MIEKLTNCPNCGGYLNDSGRCEFCGSKVFDFLSIDFGCRNMPSAKTYIRIKSKGKVYIAPVRVDTVNITIPSDTLYCSDLLGDSGYLTRQSYPNYNVDFIGIGEAIIIDEESRQWNKD